MLAEADERAEAHVVIAYGFQAIDQLLGVGLRTSPFQPLQQQGVPST